VRIAALQFIRVISVIRGEIFPVKDERASTRFPEPIKKSVAAEIFLTKPARNRYIGCGEDSAA
jgi:hypothetical protein